LRWVKGVGELRQNVFFNTHYYGRSILEFVQILVSHGVKTLVDTRSKPTSRRYEFDGQNLARSLVQYSIVYVSAPQLGCPDSLRLRAWRRGDYKELWDWYTKNVITGQLWDFIEELASYPKPVAFMCVERDPAFCHRHLIGDALKRVGYKVIDI
jgi:uncharacterized protein (DUF488 family)